MGAEIVKTYSVGTQTRSPTWWRSAFGWATAQQAGNPPRECRVRAYRVTSLLDYLEIGRAYSATPDREPFRDQPIPT